MIDFFIEPAYAWQNVVKFLVLLQPDKNGWPSTFQLHFANFHWILETVYHAWLTQCAGRRCEDCFKSKFVPWQWFKDDFWSWIACTMQLVKNDALEIRQLLCCMYLVSELHINPTWCVYSSNDVINLRTLVVHDIVLSLLLKVLFKHYAASSSPMWKLWVCSSVCCVIWVCRIFNKIFRKNFSLGKYSVVCRLAFGLLSEAEHRQKYEIFIFAQIWTYKTVRLDLF